jgi:hypothetical protein
MLVSFVVSRTNVTGRPSFRAAFKHLLPSPPSKHVSQKFRPRFSGEPRKRNLGLFFQLMAAINQDLVGYFAWTFCHDLSHETFSARED